MGPSKSVELKVGMLVILGIGLFIMTTLLLGGGNEAFVRKYDLKVRFESVPGISAGSVVQVAGITVGNVKDVAFVPNSSLIEVTMSINRSFQSRVTEGSVAGVRTQGALGDKYIYITPGDPSAKALEDNTVLPTEIGGDLFSTLAKRGDDLQKLFDTINEVHRLVANLNADGKSAQLMPNLVKATDELGKTLGEMHMLIKDVRGGQEDQNRIRNTLASLENVLKKIDRGTGTLGALINDPEIHERLKSFLGGSNQGQFLKNQVRETIKSR